MPPITGYILIAVSALAVASLGWRRLDAKTWRPLLYHVDDVAALAGIALIAIACSTVGTWAVLLWLGLVCFAAAWLFRF